MRNETFCVATSTCGENGLFILNIFDIGSLQTLFESGRVMSLLDVAGYVKGSGLSS